MGQRLVLMMTVALVCAGAGSALSPSPASAGVVNGDLGVLFAGVYNLTPYPWTLVAANSIDQSGNVSAGLYDQPAATIPPGGSSSDGVGANFRRR
ncbi:MAG: hypothetical protein JO262_20710, partial [Solirubrobacterales bacterium]|nr:hypothetical protein [Solirubrobacterales bacterium]